MAPLYEAYVVEMAQAIENMVFNTIRIEGEKAAVILAKRLSVTANLANLLVDMAGRQLVSAGIDAAKALLMPVAGVDILTHLKPLQELGELFSMNFMQSMPLMLLEYTDNSCEKLVDYGCKVVEQALEQNGYLLPERFKSYMHGWFVRSAKLSVQSMHADIESQFGVCLPEAYKLQVLDNVPVGETAGTFRRLAANVSWLGTGVKRIEKKLKGGIWSCFKKGAGQLVPASLAERGRHLSEAGDEVLGKQVFKHMSEPAIDNCRGELRNTIIELLTFDRHEVPAPDAESSLVEFATHMGAVWVDPVFREYGRDFAIKHVSMLSESSPKVGRYTLLQLARNQIEEDKPESSSWFPWF